MKMKKIVLVLMVAAAALTMNAQPAGRHRNTPADPAKMVEQRVDRLNDALDLTDAQKEDLTKIFTEEMGQMKANKDKAKPDREAMKKQREETDARVKSVLTPEQQAKYDEMQKNAPRGHRSQGHRDGNRGDKMKGCGGQGCCCKQGEKPAEPAPAE